MPKQTRTTIYDLMDAKGVFELNPSNPVARDSEGRSMYRKQDFPRLVYHPEGKERVLVQGERVFTPGIGVEILGQQMELIYKEVKTAEEFEEALAEGWHKHPAHAIKAGGREMPPTSTAETISDLEEQLRAKEEELERLRAEAAISTKAKAPAKLGL